MRRRAAARAGPAAPSASERYYLASQWQLAWRKLIRHRLALAGGGVLLLLYVAALFAGFIPPYGPFTRNFGITLILSIVGWTGLARVVRGKLLELRESDFVMAARVAGALDGAIIRRHLLPSFMSYLIVSLTLAVPGMILGETALSFLGLGLRPPVVSWGLLLQKAQNLRTVALHPWLLIPAGFVVVTVLAFNFLGDGLRDAADPYK